MVDIPIPPISLTLFDPAYWSVSKDRMVWFEVGFQIFLEIKLVTELCTIFERINEILMTRALKKVIRFYDFSLVGEAFDPVRKSPTFKYSLQTFFPPTK